MERLWFADFKPSRPGAVGYIHESNTQQLVIVISRPVEHHTGAWQCGDVSIWICCALECSHSASYNIHLLFKALRKMFLLVEARHVLKHAFSQHLLSLLQTLFGRRPVCVKTDYQADSEVQKSQCGCPGNVPCPF